MLRTSTSFRHLVRVKSARTLSSTGPLLESSLKRKLDYLKKHERILRKSPNELKRIKENKSIKTKKELKRGYTKQKAFDVIKKYNLESSLVNTGSIHDVGPTTDNNVKLLATTRDKRLIYTILGITGEQLRDSKLVYEDAAKFIRRGQLEKAVFLAKLAKQRGSAAMNLITEHYLNDLQSPNSGIDMYNWRKKVNIPLNEYSNTILFSGLANQKKHISKKNGEFVYNTVQKLIEDHNLNQKEYNSALGALSNCTDVTYAIRLFQNVNSIKGVHHDTISHLWMCRTLTRVKTTDLFIELFNEFITSIKARDVDQRLIFEVCKILHQKDDMCSSLVKAVDKYYKTDFGSKWTEAVDKESLVSKQLKLPELKDWELTEKYAINRHVIGLLLENSVKTGSWKLGEKIFRKTLETNSALIDMNMFHSYLELLVKSHPVGSVARCFSVMDDPLIKKKNFDSKHTLILLYRAFIAEASKATVNMDPSKVDDLLDRCDQFIRKYDMKNSVSLATPVYSRESWLYVFQILKKIGGSKKIGVPRQEKLLDECLKTMSSGYFDLGKIKPKDYKSQIYIELEVVRLISGVADQYIIPDFEIQQEETKTDKFLHRRLLLRLKQKMLMHIGELEGWERKKKVIESENLEWSIKQISKRLLNKDYGAPEGITDNSSGESKNPQTH